MFKLYRITTKCSHKYYVGMTGRTLRWRFNSHKCAAKRGKKSYLYNAIRKHGEENFEITLIGSFATRKECLEVEQCIIRKAYLLGHELYNITKGGDGGWAVPDEDKEQWREKLKLARIGRTPALGMKHTDETKELCRLASEDYWGSRRKYEIDLSDLSFQEANKLYGISKTHYYRLLKRRAQTNDLC